MKKINLVPLLSILIGTVLEWYDFSLVASMAPIMSLLFFPYAHLSCNHLKEAAERIFVTSFTAI